MDDLKYQAGGYFNTLGRIPPPTPDKYPPHADRTQRKMTDLHNQRKGIRTGMMTCKQTKLAQGRGRTGHTRDAMFFVRTHTNVKVITQAHNNILNREVYE